jgi:acetyltransferase-like isoleucine patch superfamily enzyme
MRTLAKRIANLLAWLLVLPALMLYWLEAAGVGRARALATWSQVLCQLPGMAGEFLRRAFYRSVLTRCEEGVVIGYGTLLTNPDSTLGNHVYIGPYGVLGEVTIEADVLIGSHVSITNGSHQHGTSRLDLPVREQPGSWPRVTIGADSWIGDRAVVMCNVGRHAVVGAGAVVTKPVPDFAIVAGVPARVIGSRAPTTPSPAKEG